MPIRVLPPEVAARIAAGEVVERPASVVKEFVENSLDAGASAVTVEITAGGTALIRVTDDGCGIEAGEMERAFERHATSKLADDADLARVLTLGFRGEALPSIAAVADVEIVSRPPGTEAATFLRLRDGRVIDSGSRGAPIGTSIRVENLFERLPARRKFLRSAASETAAIAAVVSHHALAYPEVRFRLVVDGRQTFHTPGSGNLRDAAAAVYGLDVGEALLDVSPGVLREAQDERREIQVTGLAGPPQLSRASRAYVSLFVNRRGIQNRRLAFAVEEAYRGMLMVGRRPVAILNIEVPYEEVDVNVHPTKTEVRFRDESAIFGAVQRAVRAALVEQAPVPAGARASVAIEPAPPLVLTAQPWSPPIWEAGVRKEGAAVAIGAGVPERTPGSSNGDTTSHDGGETSQPSPGGTITQTLPVLRVIGQFGGVYIIAEGPEGMYLIDQHAAHERVLYEMFASARTRRSPEVQGLLEPVALELPTRQRAMIEHEHEALAQHGFELEPFGDGAVLLRALPQTLAGGDVREKLARFLDVMLEEDGADGRDRVAMSLACHGAIRAGKTLAPEEMRELVRQLEETEAPHTCPHGRPTMVHVSAEMLAKGFGRR